MKRPGEPDNKTCIECKLEQPIDSFHTRGNYRRNACVSCCSSHRVKMHAQEISEYKHRFIFGKMHG